MAFPCGHPETSHLLRQLFYCWKATDSEHEKQACQFPKRGFGRWLSQYRNRDTSRHVLIVSMTIDNTLKIVNKKY